jgi:hypothetical protein
MREKLARADERLQVLNQVLTDADQQQQQPADEDEKPIDPTADIFGAFNQAMKKIAKLEGQLNDTTTRQQQATTEQQVRQVVQQERGALHRREAPSPKVDPVAKEKMERIKQGQELSRSLTNVGGAPGDTMTIEALVMMPRRNSSKRSGRSARRSCGGWRVDKGAGAWSSAPTRSFMAPAGSRLTRKSRHPPSSRFTRRSRHPLLSRLHYTHLHGAHTPHAPARSTYTFTYTAQQPSGISSPQRIEGSRVGLPLPRVMAIHWWASPSPWPPWSRWSFCGRTRTNPTFRGPRGHRP